MPSGIWCCCSTVAAMNFSCFLPKESFQCLCANLILLLYAEVGEGKTCFLLCFNILNYKPHQEESSPFGIVTPSTRQTIWNLHRVQSWFLGDVESPPLGLDMVPWIVVKCVGRGDLNFWGRDKQWTVARTNSCLSDFHSPFL